MEYKEAQEKMKVAIERKKLERESRLLVA